MDLEIRIPGVLDEYKSHHLETMAWAVLSDEQMSNGYPFSLLNDEQMSNKVGVKHQPVAFVLGLVDYS